MEGFPRQPSESTEPLWQVADRAVGLVKSWGEERSFEDFAALIAQVQAEFEQRGVIFILPRKDFSINTTYAEAVKRIHGRGGAPGTVISVISPGVAIVKGDSGSPPISHLKAKVEIVG